MFRNKLKCHLLSQIELKRSSELCLYKKNMAINKYSMPNSFQILFVASKEEEDIINESPPDSFVYSIGVLILLNQNTIFPDSHVKICNTWGWPCAHSYSNHLSKNIAIKFKGVVTKDHLKNINQEKCCHYIFFFIWSRVQSLTNSFYRIFMWNWWIKSNNIYRYRNNVLGYRAILFQFF